MTIVNDILKQMPAGSQPQRKFLATLFATILTRRGRINFRNLSRYCDYSERPMARQFRVSFAWPDFHQRVMIAALHPRSDLISAQDASFIPKSGKQKAERMFGWGRETLAGGLAERRTGVTCVGAQSAFSGRPRWEAHQPQAAAALRSLAEAHAPQAPPFRTPLAYTRLTATAAGAALSAQGFDQEPVPAPSTRAPGLKRLGFRLRKVRKANPPKKSAQTDALCDNLKKRRASGRLRQRQTLEQRV